MDIVEKTPRLALNFRMWFFPLPSPSSPPPFLDEKIVLSMVKIKKKKSFQIVGSSCREKKSKRRGLKMKRERKTAGKKT